ncbi:hypothetical protein [Catellatospora methionotrophica]|uniref:hypothetical protein n=1 Tax=Catellatospora methionotrophica TaxID=121620 RepID=UPI0033EE5ED1
MRPQFTKLSAALGATTAAAIAAALMLGIPASTLALNPEVCVGSRDCVVVQFELGTAADDSPVTIAAPPPAKGDDTNM